jgi:hypothetical protein
LLPCEAVQGAREAGGSAQVDVSAALAWWDFMVSGYSDAGQQRWLAERGIELLRGTGRLAGIGVVDVGDVRHTAAVPVSGFTTSAIELVRDQFLRVNDVRPLPADLVTELLP